MLDNVKNRGSPHVTLHSSSKNNEDLYGHKQKSTSNKLGIVNVIVEYLIIYTPYRIQQAGNEQEQGLRLFKHASRTDPHLRNPVFIYL